MMAQLQRATRRWLPALVLGAAAASVAACGGGGSTPSAQPPKPGDTTQWPIGTSGSQLTAYLNGNTVTATLPAPLSGTSAANPATVSMTLSATPPQGLPASSTQRAPRSAGPQPLLYIILAASSPVVLPNIPGFDITQAVSHPGPEYIAQYVAGSGWTKVEGPVDGTPLQVHFPPPAPPIQLALGPTSPAFFALFGDVATPTQSPNPSGSASPNPSASPTARPSGAPTPTPTPTPTPNPLSVSPNAFTLGVGATQQVTIQETGYNGNFGVNTTNCPSSVATISTPGTGPSTTATVTGLGIGSCTITISDSNGQSKAITVSVTAITLSGASIAPDSSSGFPWSGQPFVASIISQITFTASEPGYSGGFTTSYVAGDTFSPVTPTSNCPSFFSVAPSGPATFTVTASGAANVACQIQVQDSQGVAATLWVIENTPTIIIQSTGRR